MLSSFAASQLAERWHQMAEEKAYSEKSTSETSTKTDFKGSPVKDSAGDNVKETTTETEGKTESKGDSND